jgi:hypothetical protein
MTADTGISMRRTADRQLIEKSLVEFASECDARRLAQSSKLLRSQDELHAAVSDEAWEEVPAVSSTIGRAIVPLLSCQSWAVPVLVTMALCACLRADSVGPLPFFDPETLRGMLTDGLEGYSDEKLARLLEITRELESALKPYRSSVERSLNAHVEELADPESDAAGPEALLATHDLDRVELMRFIIQSRQRPFAIPGV